MSTKLELEKMTKTCLQELCSQKNLITKGTRAVLIEKLLSSSTTNVPPNIPEPPPTIAENCIWIGSFDIGKNNFSFCIEEVNPPKIAEIEYILPKNRFIPDGTPTEEYKKILDKVVNTGKIILIDNVSLMDNCKRTSFDPTIFSNMNKVLEKYTGYWSKCTKCIIETQMSFGKMINLSAIKLAQHCFSWFNIKLPQIKVFEFPAYHKTKVLGAPKKMTKPQRKKWAVKKASEILQARNDQVTIQKIQQRCKQDDECDVIVQLQAFKILDFIDNSF
jgi:hypothetical protein